MPCGLRAHDGRDAEAVVILSNRDGARMQIPVNPAMIDELVQYERGRVRSADFTSKSCITQLAGFCLFHLRVCSSY
jgi:hypothetical protein